MRVYIALDIKRNEGPNLSADAVADAFEDEIPETFELDASFYDVKVIGTATRLVDLPLSIKRRSL